MSKKIKLGVLGGGKGSLVGILHRIASGMYGDYEIVGGIFNSDYTESLKFAEESGIPADRVYRDLESLIKIESSLPVENKMQAVCILTPNYLHFPMAKKLLEARFHVICEKPMTMTLEEAMSLKKEVERSQTIFAVTYTYTGYPMLRQMREIVRRGDLGAIQKIDIQYYQGWINPVIHNSEKRANTWRLNPEISGISCCIGDIGTHAFNLIEYTTGLEVDEILADLNFLYKDNPMDIDGTVLLRFSPFVKGIIRASQIATGEENNLTVSIYGSKAGLKWEQENPNYLHLLEEGKPLQILKSGNPYNSDLSLSGTKLPPGHPEGIFDAMANIYRGIAKAIRKEKYCTGEFPTIDDGLKGMNFIEKVYASHQEGSIWVKMKPN